MGATQKPLVRIANRLLSPFGAELRPRYLPDHPNTPDYQTGKRPVAPRFLNIGAGVWRHPLWHNLDYATAYYQDRVSPYIDFPYDLMAQEPLPVSDATIEAVYISHVNEHIPDAENRHLFKEIVRVMKPGGVLRILTPDVTLIQNELRFERPFTLNMRRQNSVIPEKRHLATLPQLALFSVISAFSALHPNSPKPPLSDAAIRDTFLSNTWREKLTALSEGSPRDLQHQFPSLHVNWFDAQKLTQMLLEAGFSASWESRYSQSLSPHMRDLRYFDNRYASFSLYVEAMR